MNGLRHFLPSEPFRKFSAEYGCQHLIRQFSERRTAADLVLFGHHVEFNEDRLTVFIDGKIVFER